MASCPWRFGRKVIAAPLSSARVPQPRPISPVSTRRRHRRQSEVHRPVFSAGEEPRVSLRISCLADMHTDKCSVFVDREMIRAGRIGSHATCPTPAPGIRCGRRASGPTLRGRAAVAPPAGADRRHQRESRRSRSSSRVNGKRSTDTGNRSGSSPGMRSRGGSCAEVSTTRCRGRCPAPTCRSRTTRRRQISSTSGRSVRSRAA